MTNWETVAMDAFFLLVVAALAGLSLGLIGVCDALMGGQP
jgi:hypothetical protein